MSPNAVPAPRRFDTDTGLPGAGLPHDRLSRIAARRAFVDLKHNFMHAVAQVDDERGRWLREQVRRAHEPEDLLLLRGHVFACLAGPDDHLTAAAARPAPQPRLAVPRQRAAQRLHGF